VKPSAAIIAGPSRQREFILPFSPKVTSRFHVPAGIPLTSWEEKTGRKSGPAPNSTLLMLRHMSDLDQRGAKPAAVTPSGGPAADVPFYPPSAAEPVPEGPFLYAVASQVHRLLHLSREQQFAIWRRVVDLYAQANRDLPARLADLLREAALEALIGNEIFWALVGKTVGREFYSRAPDYIPAVYATAALMVARQDTLSLDRDDELLFAGESERS
jgi:hypothetical protein